jgi:uncharacterized membrane protein (DUF485 family)
MEKKKKEVSSEEKKIHEEVNEQLSKLKVPLLRELEGLLSFLFMFVIIIPFFLFKLDNNLVLLYYFSNLDLIANVMNHWDNFFDNLYFPNPLTEYSFFSSSVIDFIAFLGISTIISNLTLINKSVYYGIAAATTLLLITRIVPTTLIYILMRNIQNYLHQFYSTEVSNNVSVFCGLIISFCFVLVEVIISQTYIGNIANLYKMLYNNIKHLI